MATISKSTHKAETNHTISGTTLSSWSRQQKLAMIASFAILSLLLAASACSKQQSPKPALASVSGSGATPNPVQSSPSGVASSAQQNVGPAAKKTKKRPAIVSYTDKNSGVSFMYPRKFALASGDKAKPDFGNLGAAPMNFTQPGGLTLATIALPDTLYPGTDFSSGFFSVNVNRSLSEQECSHFAFVDTSDADGEPIDAQKVKIGGMDMEMTSEFTGSATGQAEARYYHTFANGACYEYILGLGTAGYGTEDGIKPVQREEVFARLEKILSTVKVQPVIHEQPAEQTVATADPAN